MMDKTAFREWKDGWPLVLSSSLGISVVTVLIYTSGIFIGPLEKEFGWSRTEITSGLLINSVIGVIFAPVIGILIDRFGPRRIALPGVAFYCCALAAFSLTTSALASWWLLWLVLAFSMLMIAPTVWAAAVASRFDRSRGLALAVTLSGTGLTGVIAPALGAHVLEQFGWRITFVVLAAVWAAACLPALWAWFYGAADLARPRTGGDAQAARSALTGLSGREVLRSSQFYRLALAVLLVMLVLSGLLVHIVPVFIGAGMSPLAAASTASMIGAATIAGRLGAGYLLDRFDGRWVGTAFFALPALLMVALLGFDGSTAMALMLAALLGLCSGAEFDIAAYLTSRYFGMKNYGLVFGIIAGALSLAMGLGPALYGAVYDHFRTYDVAFYSAIPATLVAAILIATLGASNAAFAGKRDA
jgi:MFS family permease